MTNSPPEPSAGYSQRPLIAKLGIKAGQRIAILNAPPDYAATLGPLPAQVNCADELSEHLAFIQFFTTSRQELDSAFPRLKAALAPNGMLWISWPKRTAKNAAGKIASDVDENAVRVIGLAHGLVDVKVAAVDAVWSGLKFVYRVQDRQK